MTKAYDNAEFGHRLKVARAEARMSQADLAEASGVDQNSIARYETGGTTPGLDKAYALARALDVTLDELVGLEFAPKEAI